ncbi:MAG: histone deacetylase [SAR324 cluster bacterium]|nr:histone deacetylase [SAR324 cluster bacterium]
MTFAIYLHEEVFSSTKPLEEITFAGLSYPYFRRVHQSLRQKLGHYPQIPLRKADFDNFSRVHPPRYLQKIRELAAGTIDSKELHWSLECLGLEYFIPGYEFSLGGLMAAIDLMKTGNLDACYCCMLGGHHSFPESGHGYTVVNTMAAAVRYAQEQGFHQVAIVDFDLHHGDGTQTIFENDSSVYHISIHHLADAFMVKASDIQLATTTYAEKVGHWNIPLLHSMHEDTFLREEGIPGEFYRAIDSLPKFRESLETFPWNPDLIFIHAGFDSHQDDGGLDITNWQDQDFQTLTRYVLEVARQSRCPVLSVQGGGYTLDVVVSAVQAHLQMLAG